MTRYRAEPPLPDDRQRRVGVLLVNLGTPSAATPAAVRHYLGEFLSDPRVVEWPRLLWWPILHGIILPLRAKKSARKYASIWTRDGSPLALHSERQAKLLKGYLAQAGHRGIEVLHAMRYGTPSIEGQLDSLRTTACNRIVILPLYPQYASSTTGAVADALAQWMRGTRNLPELRMIRSFYDSPQYIHALAETVRAHWRANGQAQKLVISFHGIPRRHHEHGDPYQGECQETARQLARALGLSPEQYLVSFQSRFGKTEWLKPYTQASLIGLAHSGTESVDVICPGFVSDSLETLEEIAQECKRDYLTAGGKDFRIIPCLNEQNAFLRTLQVLIQTQAADWLAAPGTQPKGLQQ